MGMIVGGIAAGAPARRKLARGETRVRRQEAGGVVPVQWGMSGRGKDEGRRRGCGHATEFKVMDCRGVKME